MKMRMEILEFCELSGDGRLNMAVEGASLYVRCQRDMLKIDLADGRCTARDTIFSKDGNTRGFAIFGDLIFLYDFLDLYILRKDDLCVVDCVRLGADLSSDIGGVMTFDLPKATVKMRNGKVCVLDVDTREIQRFDVSDATFWGHCVVGGSIFAGAVSGELLEIDREKLRVVRKMGLCRKNIYSVVHREGILYTASQDGTIRAVDVAGWETTRVARRAVRGMAVLLGTTPNHLVAADSGQISLWDLTTLEERERFSFPVGRYNQGAMLAGRILYGCDEKAIYTCEVE